MGVEHCLSVRGSDTVRPVGRERRMSTLKSRNRRFHAFASAITIGAVLGIAAPGRSQSRIEVTHAFPSMGPDEPVGSLTKAADGNLYGVTMLGGEHGRGAIYRLTLDGAVATLYS